MRKQFKKNNLQRKKEQEWTEAHNERTGRRKLSLGQSRGKGRRKGKDGAKKGIAEEQNNQEGEN